MAEELADILEVVHSLALENGLTMEEIENFRLNKRNLKGGFDNQIYNSFIDIQEDNPAIDYYLSKINHYPEITPQASCIFRQIANQEKKAELIANFEHCFVIKDLFPVIPRYQ